MNEVNSPTRRYVANSLLYIECCKENEHLSIESAIDCMILKNVNPLQIGVHAIDWAFGERAIVPTFGAEWKRISDYKTLLKRLGA